MRYLLKRMSSFDYNGGGTYWEFLRYKEITTNTGPELDYNVGRFIKLKHGSMSPQWIPIRRYFLQTDRLLRVTDVERLKRPDMDSLRSTCVLSRPVKPTVVTLLFFSPYAHQAPADVRQI